MIFDIPKIKKVRNDITIFSVDTALKTLLVNDIMPDFIVSLDSQYYSIDDFVNRNLDEIFFIFDLTSHPIISGLYKNVFFTMTENIFNDTLIEYSFKYFNLSPNGIVAGGNVSDYALFIAVKLGFKNIYFSGLDLSFPFLQTHAKNSPFYDRTLYLSDYFYTQESVINSVISLRGLKDSESRYNGMNILTDFVLMNYSSYLSNFALMNKNVKFYYQDSFGLKIENFKTADILGLAANLGSERIVNAKLIESSKKSYLKRNDLQKFYISLVTGIHDFAVKINNLINETDFSKNDRLIDWSILFERIYNDFPFLKKFGIITQIILDKKKITEKDILYYKHVGHITLQSIYFIIRIIQKILSKF